MGRRIGIAGAGIGGLAAAALLARLGYAVTVFERASELRPVGAGLLIQPSGMAVLNGLGAGAAVRELSSPVSSLHATTARGRTVLKLAYADLSPGAQGWGVHRAALHGALVESAVASGARLVTGARVERVLPNGGARELLDAEHRSLGTFDLVVVADGARSVLRRQVGRVRRATPYPWGAVWFVARDPGCRFTGVLRQRVRGTRRMLGFLPSGRAAPGEPESVSVFWSVRVADWHATTRGGRGFDLAGWKRSVLELCPDAGDLLDQVRTAEDLVFAPYFDVDVRQRDPAAVVIGESAHATSPQLGQGANLALLDAAALSGALAEEPTVTGAIERFAGDRAGATRYYRVVSRLLTPFFQSDVAALGVVRDLFMAPACRVPPLRREMLTALAGVKRGWLRADPVRAEEWAVP